MKTLKYLALTALALAAFALPARADLIDLGQRSLMGGLGDPAGEAAFIEMDQGLAPGSLTYLQKFDNPGGFDTGMDPAVDPTHFGVTIIDSGANAQVNWDLSNTGFQLSYVLVKDGVDSETKLQLYHLYGVTADQVFNSNGDQLVTINGSKNISHISFFGMPGNMVPDGGSTVALLGLGLATIGLIRHKFRI
jgi:hypothetical protein